MTVGGASGDFALARYTGEGTLDTTFTPDGTITTSFGAGTDVAIATLIEPNGKIVLAGSATVNRSSKFALARYTQLSGATSTRVFLPTVSRNSRL